MNSPYLIFLFRLLIFTGIINLFYYFVQHSIPEKFYFENTFYLFVLFFIVTAAFHFGLLYSSAKSNRSFVSYYMMATALKLFLLLAIIVIYALLNRDNAVAFISNFFVLYILYTVFEVILVNRFFRKNTPKAE